MKQINLNNIPYIAECGNLPSIADLAKENNLTNEEIRHTIYFLYAEKKIDFFAGKPLRVGRI